MIGWSLEVLGRSQLFSISELVLVGIDQKKKATVDASHVVCPSARTVILQTLAQDHLVPFVRIELLP